MKQVTSFLLLLFFLISTVVYSQGAGSGLTKSELEKAKLARMLVTSEQAPGTLAGPVQYTDDDYDLQFEYPCGDASGEAGAESDGNYIYTTKWNGAGFFKYGLDGTFMGAFQVGTVQAIRDLAYDGTYFYGGAAATTIYKMDFNTLTLVGTMVAGTATRAIAYDEAEDAFYSNNWSTPIVLWDRTGAVLGTIPTAGDESYYGLAYDHQGPYLWGYSQKVGTSQNMLYKLALPAGTVAGSFDMLTILTIPIPGTDIAGGLYFQPDIVQGTNTLGGIVQNKCIWGVEMGLTGPPPTIDVGVQAFVTPVSGPYLGNETVKITVKNFGANPASNIPVSYTLDGGAAVNGVLAGPIASGATADFTFPGTVNLSNPGQTYVFVGCTALAGDVNAGNNCKTHNVTNVIPTYCDASTTTEDEYIANVLCGSINNSSGWQGGVANYTNITTTINAGASEAITITNGTPWASDIVYCWADWNKDFTFGTGDELFMLTNVGGTGATFTGAIAVPAGTPNGEYRLRIRMTYSTAPTPCGSATYGEVEDYTIVVGGVPPTLNPPQNLAGMYVAPNSAVLTWDAPEEDGEWLGFCGPNDGGLGLEGGGSFFVSAHWTQAQVAPYVGFYLTKVSIFPTSTDNATYVLKIWTGVSGATLVHNQPLNGLVFDEWNDIIISTPLMIPNSDCWVGYEVTHNDGDNPAGIDAGPAVAGSGDMVSFDGTTWESLMNTYGLDYNFNIEVFVTEDADGQVAQPLPNKKANILNQSNKLVANMNVGGNSGEKSRATLTGYNIYRDDVMIGSTGVAVLTYTDAGLAAGTYSYTVKAVYDEGLSAAAGPVSVTIPGGGGPLIYEPFEDYTAGGYLAQQANAMGRTYWTTWSNAPGTAEDPFVTNAQASAGSKSVVIEGTNDCVLLFGDKTSGNYDINFNMYVANGFLGYFNLLHAFAGASSEWGLQVYFDVNGAGLVDAGGAGAATFTFGYDVWIPIKINVDLDNDWCKFYVNNSMVVEYQWSLGTFGTPGLNQLSAANFYAWNVGASPKYYIDEVVFDEAGVTPVPVIVVNPMSLVQQVAPNGTAQNLVNIANTGGANLTYDITIEYLTDKSASQGEIIPDSPEAIAALNARMEADGLSLNGTERAPGTTAGPVQYTDNDFDLQFEYPCGDASGEAGAESDGNYIYTTKWNGSGFFKYGLDGTFMGAFAVGSVQAIRDLAFDGTYMYGGAAATTVYQMDFNTNTLVSTMTAGTATRAIAYDEVEDGFWSNNWSTPIVLWDRSGAVLNTIATAGDESYYGFAYDHQGPYLWGYSQRVGTSQNMLYKMDIATGSVVDEFDMLSILTLPTPGTDIAGGLYFQPDMIQGTNTLGGIVQNICIWGIEMGLTGPPPTTDVGVQSFVSPVSGPELGNETVTIKVKNFGANSVSNIPVSYTMDGGAAVTGTLAGPIAAGATADFTFPGTVNLSNPGQTYVFVGCTALAGDQNPGNDCKTSNVTNVLPQYCDASTTTEDEWIANVLCGDINNPSGWQGGVANYTNISTQIDAGASEDITVENGNAWASDIVYCWADWNMDYTFGTGDEEFQLTNVGGTGQTFTGAISVPAGTPNGEYRLRIRMTYSTAPTPCGSATYGEVEDYTIVVGGSTGPNWLSVTPTTGSVGAGQNTNVTLNFDAAGLAGGQYAAKLHIANNSATSPVDVDVTMIVGSSDWYVSPALIAETHNTPPQVTTKTVTVTNNTSSALNWNLVVNTSPVSDNIIPDSPEAIALLAQREAQDGIAPTSLGFDPLGSRVPAGYKPADLKGLRGEIAYGNNVEGNTFYELDVETLAASVIGSTTYAGFCGDFAPGDVDNMYIIDYNDDVLKMVDIATGVATPIASVPCPMAPNGIWTELAIDKTTGIFYATATDINVSNLYEIDPNSGAITLIGNCGIAAIISCTIDLSGTMYAFDIVSDNTYTVDLATGVGTLLGPAGFNGNYAQGMGYDAVNDKVYLAAYSTFAELRELNTSTGATTALGALPGETGAFGFPYQGGPQPGVDVGVTAFVSPVSGPYLSNETVTIKVKNFGTNSVSNIPVSYTLDGGAAVTGTLAGPIASGATADFTFPGTVNLGNPGQTYVFVGCTALAGDENSNNNCKTANVTHVIPTYCDATTQIEDEYIANVLCGDINNSSGWQGGVANYTAISTQIDAGMSEDITITNGNAWASDIVYCWADWNKDFTFGTGDEQYMLTNVGGTGQTFTGTISVPAGVPNGEYRFRIRMTYSTAPVPCGDATYGEVEDYTIVVGGVNPTAWLSADPLSGTIAANSTQTVTVTLNSATLAPGTYTGSLVFSAPANPASITVPVTLTVGQTGGAVIAVNPGSFLFELGYNQTETQTMTVSNSGSAALNCVMTITYDNQAPVFNSFDVEAYRGSQSTAYLNAESRPENTPSGVNINTTDAMWDLQFSAPAGDASGEAGIETDGNFIYTTKWNGAGFFKYEMDGTFIGPMTVGSVQGIRDLAFDGTYMYGGAAATTVYKMDFSTQTLIGQFTAPTAVRAIAYDYDEDGFYANNWSTPIVLFDASGATLNTLPTAGDESYYGFAYDNNNGSKHLYGFSQKVGLSGGVIFELALPGGTPTGVSHDVVTELATPGTDLAGGLFTCNNWFVNGTTSIGGLVQNVVLFAYELHATEWLSLSTYNATVAPNGSANVGVICNTDDFDGELYYASIWIANNSTNNQMVEVPVTLDLIDAIGENGADAYVMMYPNPTTDFVNIKSNSNINQVRIFNQAGQLVLSQEANGYDVRVETNNFNTGTYFVEISSAAGVVTSKLIVK